MPVLTGCVFPSEDSWKHYSGGGMYATKSPSMSPDGLTIVFSSPRTGSGDIYRINRDGSNPVRLTDSPSFEADPIFSPDGSTIAFVREADGRRHIWLMDKDGSNQRQLTFGRVLDDLGSFSPDGSHIVFERSGLPTGLGRTVAPFAVAVVGSRESVRALDAYPEYSFDGKKMTYDVVNQSARRFEVWIADADEANKRFLTVGNSPRLSPDGKTVLCAREISSPGGVWVAIDADGSRLREVGRMDRPRFAPDGKHIVALSPEYRREIWRMHPDGSNRTRLAIPSGYIDDLRPCRDGFIVRVVEGNDRVGDIYVINTTDWSVERVASMQ